MEIGRNVSEIVQTSIMYPTVYPRILYSTLGIIRVGPPYSIQYVGNSVGGARTGHKTSTYGGSPPYNSIRKPLLVACVNLF